jgi:hypothetical protein
MLLWMDLLDRATESTSPAVEVTLPPPEEFEVRHVQSYGDPRLIGPDGGDDLVNGDEEMVG